MEIATYTLTGLVPLIMHSSRLADPLQPVVQAIRQITAKRKRTDSDERKIAQLEWEGGLNIDDEGYPIITSEQIEAMICEAAKARRMGKDVVRGLCVENHARISYAGMGKGPPDLATMFSAGANTLRCAAKLKGTQTVMRTRPIFRDWSARITVTLVEFDRRTLNEVLEHAGRMTGIGDWRPKYGRFEVEAVK